jgi:hypothetical protein
MKKIKTWRMLRNKLSKETSEAIMKQGKRGDPDWLFELIGQFKHYRVDNPNNFKGFHDRLSKLGYQFEDLDQNNIFATYLDAIRRNGGDIFRKRNNMPLKIKKQQI